MKRHMHEPHISLNSGATQPVNDTAIAPFSRLVTTRQDRSPEFMTDLRALPPAVLELAMLLAQITNESTEFSAQSDKTNEREQS